MSKDEPSVIALRWNGRANALLEMATKLAQADELDGWLLIVKRKTSEEGEELQKHAANVYWSSTNPIELYWMLEYARREMGSDDGSQDVPWEDDDPAS